MPHEQNPSEQEQDREAEDADYIEKRAWELLDAGECTNENDAFEQAEKELRETQSFERGE